MMCDISDILIACACAFMQCVAKYHSSHHTVHILLSAKPSGFACGSPSYPIEENSLVDIDISIYIYYIFHISPFSGIGRGQFSSFPERQTCFIGSSSPKFTMDIGVGDHAVQWLGVVFCLSVVHTQAERDIGCYVWASNKQAVQ